MELKKASKYPACYNQGVDIADSVTKIKGVGEEISKRLEKLGIETMGDLINFYPRRYDDFSKILPIDRLKPGQVTVKGTIKQIAARRTRKWLSVTEAVISDPSGSIKAIWFNQPYLAKQLPVGSEVYLSGMVDFKYNQYAFLNPTVEPVKDFNVHTARIVPVYPTTEGITSKQLRSCVEQVLPVIDSLEEVLPAGVLKKNKLPARAQALRHLHFPEDSRQLAAAQRRLAFEEVFLLILTGLVIKSEIETEEAHPISFDEQFARDFVKKLGFKLTDAQRKAAWRILQDMNGTRPMNRLLEGDVGSGKTVVATMAAAMAIRNGLQAALMVPTETLAHQHYKNIEPVLRRFKMSSALIVGSESKKARGLTYGQIAEGSVDFVIGTHALIQKDVAFHGLGLVIIDEQHRFGVKQRQILKAKAGHLPHLLSMTATPIPRSLALTVYGDLDISVIDELPPGRQPVETKVISPYRRRDTYLFVDQQIATGRQVYVVCPLISESDKLGVKSVEKEAETLKQGVFSRRRIAVLHGRMKTAEKQAVMDGFKKGEIDILVSTTVVEVGIDVANASVMIIEGAERFGLATLHQLRGRVGRGAHKSHCFLLATDDRQGQHRLALMERYQDGFRLAQKDLEMRGPGQIYGTRQHGLLELRLADITDLKFTAWVRQEAQSFFKNEQNLLQYPQLVAQINKLKTLTTLD